MVTDPAMREQLMPRGFPFATKRPSVDSGYFPTFNRDNVTLVDIRAEPIESLDATGLQPRGSTTTSTSSSTPPASTP